MKILHICLCGAMTDGLNYQENLLSKYHKKMGFDVTIIASQYIWDKNGKIVVTNKNNYINSDGVKILRLKIVHGNINNRFKLYKGLYKCISNENPDILFVHDCQFLNLITIANYVKLNRQTRVYIDNHVDYSNGAHGWMSKNILHRGVWKFCVSIIEPYVEKFYGVLPARVDFLIDLYKLPKEKCELLIMGADDENVSILENEVAIQKYREKYNINRSELTIVSGGKINEHRPEVLNLMAAVKKCSESGYNVKLIVFGNVSELYEDQFQDYLKCPNIAYIGWISPKESYEVMKVADIVCFPGLHSVMWEQAVALGIPCIFRDIEGFHHVDIGGNALFVKDPSERELENIIVSLISNPQLVEDMKTAASKEERNSFLYSRIARQSLQMEN